MGLLERIKQLWRRDDRVALDGGPRILAYCTSTIGMGHYCRLLRVLTRVKALCPEASILLMTDVRDCATAAQAGVAVLQLPRFRFRDQERFKEEPELLGIGSDGLRALRAELMLATGRTFQPHVLMMDTNPHGKRDEVLPLLKYLRRRGNCRTILLMRDIPSPPGETYKLSGTPGAIRKHAGYYDRLLIAGDRNFYNAAEVFNWPEDVQAKAVWVGFVISPLDDQTRGAAFDAYPQLDSDVPTVAVSFGGGWQVEKYAGPLMDGLELVRQREKRPLQMALALGPAATAEQMQSFSAQAGELGGIAIEQFSTHFPHLLAHADMAVLQAGSAPFQVLETDIPILLTYRPYRSREQEERAHRLAGWPGVRLVECLNGVSPADCAEWIAWGLAQARTRRETHFRFDGIEQAAREVIAALPAGG